jgi:hypothetical protein
MTPKQKPDKLVSTRAKARCPRGRVMWTNKTDLALFYKGYSGNFVSPSKWSDGDFPILVIPLSDPSALVEKLSNKAVNDAWYAWEQEHAALGRRGAFHAGAHYGFAKAIRALGVPHKMLKGRKGK